LVVDVQVDFCPGGSLAVEGGDEVVAGLNAVIGASETSGLPIFFTRDWHPRDHISFKDRGGVWPPHCIQGTPGAGFHPGLLVPAVATIISKGDQSDAEAYSGFQGTDLSLKLRNHGVGRIFLGGLTTDYCVRQSALDALRLGFKVDVLVDCIRAVDVHPGDGDRALEELKNSGVGLTTSGAVLKELASAKQ
jgi:nicotinamidase-related amidase